MAVAVFEMNRPSIAVMTNNVANTRYGAVPQTELTLPGVYFVGCSFILEFVACQRRSKKGELIWTS
jgi:hypothetical protein